MCSSIVLASMITRPGSIASSSRRIAASSVVGVAGRARQQEVVAAGPLRLGVVDERRRRLEHAVALVIGDDADDAERRLPVTTTCTVWPMADSSGQKRRAMVSFTTATPGAPSVSAPSMSRPSTQPHAERGEVAGRDRHVLDDLAALALDVGAVVDLQLVAG